MQIRKIEVYKPGEEVTVSYMVIMEKFDEGWEMSADEIQELHDLCGRILTTGSARVYEPVRPEAENEDEPKCEPKRRGRPPNAEKVTVIPSVPPKDPREKFSEEALRRVRKATGLEK